MSRPAQKSFITFSFKCEEGKDDDLIDLLVDLKPRSEFIRNSIRAGKGMPIPSGSDGLTVDDLRSELARLRDDLMRALGSQRVTETTQTAKARGDVNDKGRNIPDF